MNHKKLHLSVALTLFAAGLFFSDPSFTSAQESEMRLIRLCGGTSRSDVYGTSSDPEGAAKDIVRIVPETLSIDKGTVVIWINAARATDCLKIVFEDGKKCEDVTDAASGFLTEGPCYVTSWVTFGGTSSLKFNEEGTYDYFVDAKGHGPEARKKGTIVVR
jgi:hypothetical protein